METIVSLFEFEYGGYPLKELVRQVGLGYLYFVNIGNGSNLQNGR